MIDSKYYRYVIIEYTGGEYINRRTNSILIVQRRLALSRDRLYDVTASNNLYITKYRVLS